MPQVVVGLGNPDAAYRETRHNVGQAVLDRLAERGPGRFVPRGAALVAAIEWGGEPLYLAKPLTFMNVVGPAVAGLLRDLERPPTALIVVHDDIDLPFGRVRVRHQGRPGGHNGVRSIIDALGTSGFRRVKIGIGRPETRDEVTGWVLAPFGPEEREILPAVLERAAAAVLELAAAAGGPP